MSFWKILAGAATGVATVVALPIAGPVGAITAVGAAVAGTVGAAGGAAIDALDDSKEQAEKRGREQAEAKNALKSEKILRAMKEMKDHVDEDDQYFSSLIAIAAVGISCANCDGEIHPEERTEIAEFVAGINHSNLPNDVKKKMDELWKKPPSIRTAFKLVEKAKTDLSLVDDVIDVVMHADNRVHAKEKAFMNAWHKLRNS